MQRPLELPQTSFDERPKCSCCGGTNLRLTDEYLHPLYGVLGVTIQVLKCESPGCEAFTRA